MDCFSAYLVSKDIYDDIGKVDCLFLVWAERGTAEPCGAHVQSAHPATADHRAMQYQQLHNTTLRYNQQINTPRPFNPTTVQVFDNFLTGSKPLRPTTSGRRKFTYAFVYVRLESTF